ncbi:hypothetical protein SAMN05421767_1019 [Granulicatella balaenopterae]|uniref:Uncharacterized protein n=1 Tax=Granulicatella balaenopterae TaxID=137733 RepID=A0A1H9GQ37_9LACT|nr:hypothetical protein [Granulicatella balaenopterae]SEQ52098.1 hypothetical protein SAMN05421767_1019 [Granulicatella balaenopterae]
MYKLDERQLSIAGRSVSAALVAMIFMNLIEIIYKILIKNNTILISIINVGLLVLIYILSLFIINKIKFKMDRYSVKSLLLSKDELIDEIRKFSAAVTFILMIIIYITEAYYYLLSGNGLLIVIFSLSAIFIPCGVSCVFNINNKEYNLSILADKKGNIYNESKDFKYRSIIYLRESFIAALGFIILDLIMYYKTNGKSVFDMISNTNPLMAIFLNLMALIVLSFIFNVIFYEIKLKIYNRELNKCNK